MVSKANHHRIASRLMQHQLAGNLRDLFRVAYRIIAARSDPHEPLPPDDSVKYGLQCLNETPQIDITTSNHSRKVAKVFAEGLPLDTVFDQGGHISTKLVEGDLKAYIAKELRRIAKDRGIRIDQLCDISERALRSWIKKKRKNMPIKGNNMPIKEEIE